ncbi:KH domain-containing, RNA-binding, signal transduction-associated protein 2-like [Schistocerca americana]|uniref:KH domain-containing, RNA-binding, signal transduction-associated protein 2-like n=1 Tax=Schistocerca americana TaxID=7009 RepID=UPI001F4F7BB5|nr:KH domain-containing, RNA-binding, signal transduction-associated protein 2-like [Schistocerca americana]XP_049940892.1 KH domain-containing, RNA-binding, signal transduction-associated protein 2-like [Schistocerca serialis cubense]
MVDITRDKPIKVTVRVVVPVRDHPKFNFVGKLLGPKGNSLKRLQEDTMTKMAILGRGSMRDKHKEEELRCSGDPKFSHLSDDLHVEITAFAPPAEAHARIAYALAEVRRFLVPDYNDEIRQEQMWEMQILNTAMQRRPLLAAASPASSESPPGSLSPGSPPPAAAAQPGGRHVASPPPPQQQPAPQQQPPPPQQQPPPPQVSAQAPLLHPALRGLEPAAAGVATGAAGVVAVAGGAQAAASAAAAAAAAVVAQQQQQQQAAAATAGRRAARPKPPARVVIKPAD